MRRSKIIYSMSYAPIGSELILTNGNLTRDQGTAFSKPISKRPKRPNFKIKSPEARNGFPAKSDYPIIVHCHLCWDWVWQRPQQFLSRLSRRHPVLFVETIGPDAQLMTPSVRLQKSPDYPNVTRLRLQF